MDDDKDNSQEQQGSSEPQVSQGSTTTDTNAGTNLPDRNPQVLERGNLTRDLEKRDK
jgi:hypothetical protein